MFTAPYTYHLPPEKIAHRAAEPRDSAKLLHYVAGKPLEDKVFSDLPDLLRAGDLLVLNDSKVIPARLYLLRAGRVDLVRGGAAGDDVKVEILLHQAKGPDLLQWTAFAKPAKRLKVGDCLRVEGVDGADVLEIVEHFGQQVEVRFLMEPSKVEAFLNAHGHTPLPPYIEARDDAETRARYQTVFADTDKPGSVAAPTAGLHFTPELLEKLAAKGVENARVTLHVGAGTFLNPTPEQIAAKRLHAEFAHVSPEVAKRILDVKARGGRVIPVGTTALRTLESWAILADCSSDGLAAETTIFIQPGYQFRVADCLMTNFHLPDSSLLMLVAAFVGLEEMQRIYGHALSHPYRFYSFGDTSLLEPAS